MSKVLCNPTNETFIGTYVGEDTVIKPGEKIKVDEARGNHLLNQLGNRGLFALDFGDEGEIEKKKTADALARNKAFKEIQVEKYNQTNMYRRGQNMEFLKAPEQIEKYAEDLGVELERPYKIQDQRSPKIEALESENAELKKQMRELMTQMQTLTASLVQKKKPKGKKATEAEAAE